VEPAERTQAADQQPPILLALGRSPVIEQGEVRKCEALEEITAVQLQQVTQINCIAGERREPGRKQADVDRYVGREGKHLLAGLER
jgi:hypothetical protein